MAEPVLRMARRSATRRRRCIHDCAGPGFVEPGSEESNPADDERDADGAVRSKPMVDATKRAPNMGHPV